MTKTKTQTQTTGSDTNEGHHMPRFINRSIYYSQQNSHTGTGTPSTIKPAAVTQPKTHSTVGDSAIQLTNNPLNNNDHRNDHSNDNRV